MNDTDELRQLAHLLRVGAAEARTVANTRGRDQRKIYDLARQAEDIADSLDEIAGVWVKLVEPESQG